MSVISNDKIIGEMYRGITPIYLYGNINEDSNGGYDEGYNDGKEQGVEEQKSKLDSIEITENGIYTKEDGYSTVTVNVPSDIPNGFDFYVATSEYNDYNSSFRNLQILATQTTKLDQITTLIGKLKCDDLTLVNYCPTEPDYSNLNTEYCTHIHCDVIHNNDFTNLYGYIYCSRYTLGSFIFPNFKGNISIERDNGNEIDILAFLMFAGTARNFENGNGYGSIHFVRASFDVPEYMVEMALEKGYIISMNL